MKLQIPAGRKLTKVILINIILFHVLLINTKTVIKTLISVQELGFSVPDQFVKLAFVNLKNLPVPCNIYIVVVINIAR